MWVSLSFEFGFYQNSAMPKPTPMEPIVVIRARAGRTRMYNGAD